METILFGLKELFSALKTLGELSQKEKAALIDFFIALKTAVAETKKHIEQSGYQRNLELQKLWLEAFKKANATSVATQDGYPSWLSTKADFWTSPQEWMNEPASMVMVKKLDDINIEIEKLKGYLDL